MPTRSDPSHRPRHQVPSRAAEEPEDHVARDQLPPALPRVRHRADIQGLRGAAVLLVVLDHAGMPGFAGGFVGVDVFLVLSGYLIGALLLHQVTATGRLGLVDFYARRARRILPAATLTLVATAVFAAVFLTFVRAGEIATDVLWAAFFAANIHFGRQETDYFASELPPSPVQHFWSLAVEEQFYLVWPALVAVVLLALWRRGSGIGSPEERLARVRGRMPLLSVVVALVCAASLWWSVTSTAVSATGAYFSTPARVWELGAGVLLALAGNRVARLGVGTAGILRLVGLCLLAWAALTFDSRTSFPGAAALVPVLGTVAVLASGADGRTPGISGLLTWRPLRGVGDVSYSFYLWHWPFLVLGAGLAQRELSLAENLGLVLLALATAFASYHLVENPFRHPRSLAQRPKAALVLWPLALVTVVHTALWAGQAGERQAQLSAEASTVSLASLSREQQAPRTGDPMHRAVARGLDLATVRAPVPYPLKPPLEDVRDDKWDRDEDCTAQTPQSSSEICPAGGGDPGEPEHRDVVLLGDSHMNMWLPGLHAATGDTSTTLLPIIKFGCTPLAAMRARDDSEYTTCLEWQAWAIGQIAEIRPDVVVVASNLHSSLIGADGSLLAGEAKRKAWAEGARRLAEDLDPVAGRVVFLADGVERDNRTVDCLAQRDTDLGACAMGVDPDAVEMNRRLEAGATAGAAEYVDATGMQCARRRCPAVVGGVVVYRGNHHVTRVFAKLAGDSLARRLGL